MVTHMLPDRQLQASGQGAIIIRSSVAKHGAKIEGCVYPNAEHGWMTTCGCMKGVCGLGLFLESVEMKQLLSSVEV